MVWNFTHCFMRIYCLLYEKMVNTSTIYRWQLIKLLLNFMKSLCQLSELTQVSDIRVVIALLLFKLTILFHRPCELLFNPLLHESIHTVDGTKLDANHMVVVYKRVKDDVQRRLIQGPTVFVPEAEEW